MGSLGFKNIMSKPVYVTAYFRLILVLCIAAFSSVQLHAQNLKKANEIAQKLSVETDHEKRADLLLELCEAQGIGQIESALDHGSRALTIFQNIKNLNGEIRAYLTLGDLELLIGNYPLFNNFELFKTI